MCFLTHWGRVTHICVGELTIIGSDNGLSPQRRQAIIWTNDGILLIGPLGTNFSEILFRIQTFSFNKMHLKMASAKWRPFCLGLNVLKEFQRLKYQHDKFLCKWISFRNTRGTCTLFSSQFLLLLSEQSGPSVEAVRMDSDTNEAVLCNSFCAIWICEILSIILNYNIGLANKDLKYC